MDAEGATGLMPGMNLPPPGRPAPWLATDDPAYPVVRRALCDVGVPEDPPGSNRGELIDQYNLAAGVAVGSYWCAAAASCWWRDANLPTPGPGKDANCDAWMIWAKATGRWTSKPSLGAVVLYGKPGDADHCGLVIMLTPILQCVEGNTSLTGYSRNGVAVDSKGVNLPRVLGYVRPHPLPEGTG